MYREYVGDQWADLVEEIDRMCHGEWHYRIPKRAADREPHPRCCGQTS